MASEINGNQSMPSEVLNLLRAKGHCFVLEKLRVLWFVLVVF